MSSVSLSVWLQSLSLSEYEEVLHQQGFTALHQLRGITQERLKEIGIVKLGHVKRILKNIPLAMQGGLQWFHADSRVSSTCGEVAAKQKM